MEENIIFIFLFILIILAAVSFVSLVIRAIVWLFSKQTKPLRGFFLANIAFILCGSLAAIFRLSLLIELTDSVRDRDAFLYENLFIWLLPLTAFLLLWSIWLFVTGKRKMRCNETGELVTQKRKECPVCGGHGGFESLHVDESEENPFTSLSGCGGSSVISTYEKCGSCGGTGRITQQETKKVKEPGKAIKVLSVAVPTLVLVALLVPVWFHAAQMVSHEINNAKQYNEYRNYVIALEDGDYQLAVALFQQEQNAPTVHNNNYHFHAQQHLWKMEQKYKDGDLEYTTFDVILQELSSFVGERARDVEIVLEDCARYIELDKTLEEGDAYLEVGDHIAAIHRYTDVQSTYNFSNNEALTVRINKATERIVQLDEYVARLASEKATESEYELATEMLLEYHRETLGYDMDAIFKMSDTVYEMFKEINRSWAREFAETKNYGEAIRVLIKVKSTENGVDNDLKEQLLEYKELYYPVLLANSKRLIDMGQPGEALELLQKEFFCFNYHAYSDSDSAERDIELNEGMRMAVREAMERCGLVWLFELPLVDKSIELGDIYEKAAGPNFNEVRLDGYYHDYVEYDLNGRYSYIQGSYSILTSYVNGKFSETRENKPAILLDGVEADDSYFVNGEFHIPVSGIETIRIRSRYTASGVAFSDVAYVQDLMVGIEKDLIA